MQYAIYGCGGRDFVSLNYFIRMWVMRSGRLRQYQLSYNLGTNAKNTEVYRGLRRM